MERVTTSRWFAVMLGLVFIAFDQWIKVLALLSLAAQSFKIGGSFAWLDIALSLNPGAFLSLGAGLGFLHRVVIDQHFSERQRLSRLHLLQHLLLKQSLCVLRLWSTQPIAKSPITPAHHVVWKKRAQ